ncbi:prenyltransferase [Clavibacter michiganensis]|uniref:Prenyltransferase n=1 Tax=Clavibacter michiganensis subsp. insidiosus TaxID=33014 RepID=A0A0D5CLQ4_9MICO|nr:prenyltransferase [Clavibacter michiganensis]AJW80224.1 prenyltransferase [Clavibacter michiganensis subsp. insidiosus]OQJ58771.1 prenyltransferase [Clavibacter michiganensis subsp. insidiosus]RII86607.1 prenyltransferase [Clavibacter michiganensis subsp. insidiosus]RIJ44079.1 prenyltransferase [Clavibacter michiganensis subsp. insidiosus]RMC86706.1 prenyltransferase [Clavibacter michiganensis subsp. insidiosus]
MSDVRARPGAAEMLRTIALSSRPLSWVNTAFPFAAAYLTVTRELDLTAILGTLYFLIPYNLAMYGINDVFDYESDMRNPRKGGVEGAVLARAMHRPVLIAVLVTNVPFLVYLVAVGSAASVAVLAVSVFAVVAYSLKGLRFKERPVLDSLTSSTHFTSPAVYGIVLAGGAFTPALGAIFAAFFLWGVASHAFGAVQDIVADREGGISSIATVLGGAVTVRIAVIAYAAAGVAMLVTGFPGVFAALLVIPYILSTAPFWSIRDEDAAAANRGWRRFLGLNFLSGFVVTMLLIAYWLANP